MESAPSVDMSTNNADALPIPTPELIPQNEDKESAPSVDMSTNNADALSIPTAELIPQNEDKESAPFVDISTNNADALPIPTPELIPQNEDKTSSIVVSQQNEPQTNEPTTNTTVVNNDVASAEEFTDALPPEDVAPATQETSQQTQDASKFSSGDWQQRECELLKKIEELEKVKNDVSTDGLTNQLKVRNEECDLLRTRIQNLEMELSASLARPGANKDIFDTIKHQHEELLTKARGMIFDQTKIMKNQELQIAALVTQVQSLKDVNSITKDLLEIRNAELKSLEERLEAMDDRFKAEKERHALVLKRAETSTHINDDLRNEYETQLAIFKELREKYEQRVQALAAENERLKESAKTGPSG